MESVLNEKGVFLWGDENVLELDGSGGPTTLRMYSMPLDCVLQHGQFYVK